MHTCACLQTGFALEVDGKVLLRGTVLAVLADTLAAHQLEGFKVGVGFSQRKCRQCIATSDDIGTGLNKFINHIIIFVALTLYRTEFTLEKPNQIQLSLFTSKWATWCC